MPPNDETRDAPAPAPTGTHAGDGPTPSLPPDGTVAQTPSYVEALSGVAVVSAAPVVSGYELLGELGEGGMGVVYRAREVAFDRDVAVKVLRAKYNPDSPLGRRFLDEARITGQLQHPSIPPVHHIGALPDGRPFLAMKLIKGDTLADLLADERAVRSRFVPAFAQVCQALAYAHSRKVIHRDLKPQNVMVGAFGEVQVMDWGLAKVLTDAPSAEAAEPDAGEGTEVRTGREPDLVTQAGAVLGTPAYMAPEQAAGEIDKVDERADVFGLGAMLCTVLTGKPPYQGPSTDAVRILAIRGELSDAFARLDGCGADPELVALCKRCLSADRDARPRHAGEVAKAVAAHLAAVEERARQAELDRVRSEERRKKRRVQWALAGTVLLLLAAAATGATVARLWRQAQDTSDRLAVEKQQTDEARNEAERLRGTAEGERDRARALQAEVERERARIAAFEYGRTVQVAYREWRDNNVAAARALLDGTNPRLRGWEWHYVDRLLNEPLLALQSHTKGVNAAAFSPDGAFIVTASSDESVRQWDARTGDSLLINYDFIGPVEDVAFSSEGGRIVAVALGRVTVFAAASGKEQLMLRGHDCRTAALDRAGSRIATACADNTARLWDAKSGALLLTLVGHTGQVNRAAFSPDGSRVVTAGDDRTARVWDAKSGGAVLTLRHSGPVACAAFSPDGTRIVTAGADGTARVWDAATGAETLTLAGHTGPVKSAAFSPSGARIVTAGADRTARVWDARSGRELFALRGHTGAVNGAAFSPDGSRVVTAGDDNAARVWDARTGAEAISFDGFRGPRWDASFSPDGSRVMTSGGDTVWVWDARTGAEVLALKGHTGRVWAAAWSPDGSQVVTGSEDNTARVWDARTGAEVLALRGHMGEVQAVCWSPDGSRIVTGSDDDTARVWDARTGAELLTLRSHKSPVAGVAFSPDGSRIITASADGTARVWDAKTGAEVLSLKASTGRVSVAAFSPDGSRVVMTDGNVARVLDARTGAEVLTLRGHTDSVNSAAFSPDGSRIVTASAGPHIVGVGELSVSVSVGDGTVRVWDAVTGAEMIAIKSDPSGVRGAAFSRDGSRIVAVGETSVKVFDSRPFRENRPPAPLPLAPSPRAK